MYPFSPEFGVSREEWTSGNAGYADAAYKKAGETVISPAFFRPFLI
jgi:hypothetical protein